MLPITIKLLLDVISCQTKILPVDIQHNNELISKSNCLTNAKGHYLRLVKEAQSITENLNNINVRTPTGMKMLL